MKFKKNTYGTKIIFMVACFIMSVSLQATSFQTEDVGKWAFQDQNKEWVTRQETGEMIAKMIGRTFSHPELLQEPEKNLTREDMVLMAVNVLGYEDIAHKLNAKAKPFKDVDRYIGAVTLMKELKLMQGYEDATFRPTQVMTKQEVGKVLYNLAERLNTPLNKIHSSYAIKANPQMGVIEHLNEVSFGWSEVVYDEAHGEVILSTSNNPSGFNLPAGFQTPLSFTEESGVAGYLLVYLENKTIPSVVEGEKVTLADYLFDSKEERKKLINQIVKLCSEISRDGTSGSFEGVTIDFENFRSKDLQQGFNTFLKELKIALDKNSKRLNVAVQPSAYYKGYDYKTIGAIADGVILMAHDYEAKSLTAEEMASGFTVTPVTPISSIYTALEEITHPLTGVEDKSKIMLQVSFASAQWQLINQKIINQKPYSPTYDKIFTRLQEKDTQRFYSDLYQNPYAVYYDGDIKNVIWYEDAQSVEAKINLGKLFGVYQLSLWRLGTIPDYKETTKDTIKLDIVSFLGLN